MAAYHGFDQEGNGVTVYTKKIISDVQESDEYVEDDSGAIFQMLSNKLKAVDFGYYLKRYVCETVGYKKDCLSVPLDDYIVMITDAFSNKGITTSSWKPTSTRLRAAVKNWLTRKTVSREAVIMLGFGLEMNLEDINKFLTKGLQESTLNPKDPVETICWYCVSNHLGYYRFRQLLAEYETLPGTPDKDRNISTVGTMILRTEVGDICDEKTLKRYLNELRCLDGRSRQSVEARRIFDQLYDEARSRIAETKNAEEEDLTEVEVNRLRDRLSRDDRLNDEQKQAVIHNLAGKRKHWTKEDITPVDFEDELYSAIPKDRSGNLLPMKKSALNEQFRGKRLNRQHIQEILDGTGTINRYDLATMSFFALSQRKELEDDSVKRYRVFVDETNAMLERCGMGQLYVANPYDTFLMICMLTDYPLGTFADVWEMSYDSDEISETEEEA